MGCIQPLINLVNRAIFLSLVNYGLPLRMNEWQHLHACLLKMAWKFPLIKEEDEKKEEKHNHFTFVVAWYIFSILVQLSSI